ncbi:MAG: PAS domain-containing protein [Planctomycetota bacterium]|nr:PAS domain-containing protein [Planctomycetota bacterium]
MAALDRLREQAEDQVTRTRTGTRTDVSGVSEVQIQRLVYELQIHREELEIQNEELRRVHVELEASVERYTDLYDFAPVGYLTVDANGSVISANLTATTMLGRDRSRLLGTWLSLYCDPNSRGDLRDHIKQVLADDSSQNCELVLVLPNQASFDARVDSSRVASNTEGEWHCRLIITDISERKSAERALIEKDKHLRSIADALPVLISYIDTELRFQFSNAAHAAWFGKSPEELDGERIHDVLGEDLFQDFGANLSDLLSDHRVEFESQVTHQQLGPRHVQLMLMPDTGSDGNVRGFHCLVIDISERKLIDEQAERRRDFSARLLRLNSKERAAYELLMRGKSNVTISQELGIGLRTAERRRQVILEKLEADSLADVFQQAANIQGVEFHETGTAAGQVPEPAAP